MIIISNHKTVIKFARSDKIESSRYNSEKDEVGDN